MPCLRGSRHFRRRRNGPNAGGENCVRELLVVRGNVVTYRGFLEIKVVELVDEIVHGAEEQGSGGREGKWEGN